MINERYKNMMKNSHLDTPCAAGSKMPKREEKLSVELSEPKRPKSDSKPTSRSRKGSDKKWHYRRNRYAGSCNAGSQDNDAMETRTIEEDWKR